MSSLLRPHAHVVSFCPRAYVVSFCPHAYVVSFCSHAYVVSLVSARVCQCDFDRYYLDSRGDCTYCPASYYCIAGLRCVASVCV